MNDLVFKIFGAPYTFDLYKGNESEIGYFQNFDNGSKENVKLTIHRMRSGKVSYSYLRYNFISSSGRPNSFFGMSVLFNKEYCKDIKKLFDLFDTIYNDLILKNGILLTELENNPTAQAKYLVQTFAEADGEVRKIESNIINNLNKYFAEDILPINSSFLESNSMVKLSGELDNTRLINALRKYSRVDISHEYSKEEDPIPSDEFVSSLDYTIGIIRDQIADDALNGVNIQSEAQNYLNKINASLSTICDWLENEYKMPKGSNPDSYLQKQPKLKKHYDKLLEIQKPLKALPNATEKNTAQTQTHEPDSPSTVDTTQKPTNPDAEMQPPPKPKISFWQEHRYQIIGVAAVALVVVTLIVYVFPFMRQTDNQNRSTNQETPELKDSTQAAIEKLVADGDSLLQKNEFDLAIAKFYEAGRTELVKNAKSKAVEYLYEQAKNTNDLAQRKQYFEKAKSYGGYPSTDNDIREVENEISKQIAADVKKRQQEPRVEQPRVISPCKDTEVVIRIEKNKKGRYSVGDQLTVLARIKETQETCTGGKWVLDYGLYAKEDENPTVFEITAVPDKGEATLRYYVGNKQKASYPIKISQ